VKEGEHINLKLEKNSVFKVAKNINMDEKEEKRIVEVLKKHFFDFGS